MIIDDRLIEYLANLSKLEISNTEKENLKIELSELIKYFEIIDSVDTKSVDLTSDDLITNIFREDLVLPSYDRKDILSGADSKNDEAFVVPKTV